MKKTILIFSTAYLPHVGGAEIAIKEISDRLSNYEFVLIAAKLNKGLPTTEKISNVTIHRIGIGVPKIDKLLLAYTGHKLADRILPNGAALNWAMMASYGGLASLKYKEKHPSVPMLLTLQEGDSRSHIYGRAAFVWNRFLKVFRSADHIQAISAYLARWATELGATSPTQIIPNGVDYQRFTREFSREDLARLRERWEVPAGGKILITVSRLVRKNGVDTLVESLRYLPHNIHVVICGSGPEQSKIEAIATKLGVTNQVHFAGFVTHHDVPMCLKAADIFVRPARSEGLGNSFLEAMAAGLVTVGTNVGGIVDFLEDGLTGFSTEPNNPTNLARTIQRALAISGNDRTAMIARAGELVQTVYNWDGIAAQMEGVFNTLCAKSS